MYLKAAKFFFKRPVRNQPATLDWKLSAPKRWLAIVRNGGPFWQTPVYGRRWTDVPPETQFLLWEKRRGLYQVAIPVIDGDWRTTLSGRVGGLQFDTKGGVGPSPRKPVRAAFTAEGHDPYALIDEAMKEVAKVVKTLRLRGEKQVPRYLDYLGWCTWDAFYHEVSESKVVGGMESLRRSGIHPGFLILDDGWLDVREDFLHDFACDAKKFPRGLGATVKKIKAKFGLKYFGIWHALNGYWAGINPEGPLAKKFELLHSKGQIRWWEKKENELHWVSPREIGRFYHEFHGWLRAEGVDLVKVDGQSALEKFSGEKMGRVSTMTSYQEALQGAAARHFATSAIHCMCNGSDVALNLSSSNVWRNSDDYYPKQPNKTQQWHVHMNALNNVWTSTFAIPDWDMFQTHGPAAEFHAAARALSGGPLYICDKPGPHRGEIVAKLALSGGKVVRFPQPALPSRDVLFTDFRTKRKLLKITNYRGDNGEIGLFHCTPVAEAITGSFAPLDVPSLKKGDYAVWLHETETSLRLAHGEKQEIAVATCEFEIATVALLKDGWACFGLLDKFASSATIVSWKAGARWAVAELVDGGEAGFVCPSRPKRVLVNGRRAKISYRAKTGLLRIDVPKGQTASVVLEL